MIIYLCITVSRAEDGGRRSFTDPTVAHNFSPSPSHPATPTSHYSSTPILSHPQISTLNFCLIYPRKVILSQLRSCPVSFILLHSLRFFLIPFYFHIIQTKILVLLPCPIVHDYIHIWIWIGCVQVLDMRIRKGIVQDECERMIATFDLHRPPFSVQENIQCMPTHILQFRKEDFKSFLVF